MWGGRDFGWAFASMLRDLRRGRLPREPHGFALFLVIVMAVIAGVALTYVPRFDDWLGRSIDQRLPR